MDRFIDFWNFAKTAPDPLFKIQYGQIYSYNNYIPNIPKYNLKSNMDRFIDLFNYRPTRKFLYLKSNMDRFIAVFLTEVMQ